MTDDKLYTSLSANTIMAILTTHIQRTRLTTSSTDKSYSLDSEDDFRSGCRNVSQQEQFFSELPSPGRSHYTKNFLAAQFSYSKWGTNWTRHPRNFPIRVPLFLNRVSESEAEDSDEETAEAECKSCDSQRKKYTKGKN